MIESYASVTSKRVSDCSSEKYSRSFGRPVHADKGFHGPMDRGFPLACSWKYESWHRATNERGGGVSTDMQGAGGG